MLPLALRFVRKTGLSSTPFHTSADATKDSVRGPGLLLKRSSVVFRCRATKMPATIASNPLAALFHRCMVAVSLFVRLVDSMR